MPDASPMPHPCDFFLRKGGNPQPSMSPFNGRNAMNENRRQILEMLAAGKITADEADRLIAALEPEPAATTGSFTGNIAGAKGWLDDKGPTVKTHAKYLRVLVESTEKNGPTTVNVRVPM